MLYGWLSDSLFVASPSRCGILVGADVVVNASHSSGWLSSVVSLCWPNEVCPLPALPCISAPRRVVKSRSQPNNTASRAYEEGRQRQEIFRSRSFQNVWESSQFASVSCSTQQPHGVTPRYGAQPLSAWEGRCLGGDECFFVKLVRKWQFGAKEEAGQRGVPESESCANRA